MFSIRPSAVLVRLWAKIRARHRDSGRALPPHSPQGTRTDGLTADIRAELEDYRSYHWR